MRKLDLILAAVFILTILLVSCAPTTPATPPSLSESPQASDSSTPPSESPQAPDPTTPSIVAPNTINLLIIDEFDPFNSDGAILYIGMSLYDVYDKLLETGYLDINTTEGTDYQSSIDNGTHRDWSSNLAGVTAYEDNIVYQIRAGGVSKAGLQRYDTREQVIELYGDPDNTYDYDEINTILEYDMGGYFLGVSVSEGHVRNWEVTVYSREFLGNHPALT